MVFTFPECHIVGRNTKINSKRQLQKAVNITNEIIRREEEKKIFEVIRTEIFPD